MCLLANGRPMATPQVQFLDHPRGMALSFPTAISLPAKVSAAAAKTVRIFENALATRKAATPTAKKLRHGKRSRFSSQVRRVLEDGERMPRNKGPARPNSRVRQRFESYRIILCTLGLIHATNSIVYPAIQIVILSWLERPVQVVLTGCPPLRSHSTNLARTQV